MDGKFLAILIFALLAALSSRYFNNRPRCLIHRCDFYNVSIFWGFLAFFSFALTLFWDIFGACRKARK
jgi:hypothetical protein